MRPAPLFFILAAPATTLAQGWDPTSVVSGSPLSIANLQSKIKTVVIMVMENRSFDNLLGGLDIWGLDNPTNNGQFCNPLNISDPSQGQACTGPTDYNSILDDPDHSVIGNNMEFYGTYIPDNSAIQDGSLTPSMNGFADEQIFHYGAEVNATVLGTQVMHYYSEEEIPVLAELSKNFVVFNRWFSDIPGPTNPNRVSLCSGTSNGAGANNFAYNAMPQKSIFQALTESGRTWKDYLVDDSIQDARWFEWTYSSGNTDKVVYMDEFYADAANGTLPNLVYINPSCCGEGTNSMHPTGPVSEGEQLIKQVYEALRASPQWDEIAWSRLTTFRTRWPADEHSFPVLTFDETGGFHDHVSPPLATPPDDLTFTSTAPNGQNYTFGFDRLGGRMPTWLISPWVAPIVEQEGMNSAHQFVAYSASSILRTVSYLWDWEPFTPRVEASPAFDHLILPFSRWTPETLPDVVQFKRDNVLAAKPFCPEA
ncbi:phospholipase C PLC-C [Kockovaella imperatae]|uniref:Phospholipase C PLC-C n=1 Tax=Kockovaella imperatae TaxID=4999 RepID=A0A1Y1U6I9_9TREE|nr:phospholipase C PLC-C [Kockovaella imperatae]ORX33628.1 phospholipase C PLC-C [Kockovaella imperatae]